MKVAKLLEMLQPHSERDVPIEIVIWDVDNQEEKLVGVNAIRFVFDANGDIVRIALEAQ